MFEILPKVTSQEGHGQKDDCYNSELFHALVLGCGNGVEDQVDHMVSRFFDLGKIFCNENTVIVLGREK